MCHSGESVAEDSIGGMGGKECRMPHQILTLGKYLGVESRGENRFSKRQPGDPDRDKVQTDASNKQRKETMIPAQQRC